MNDRIAAYLNRLADFLFIGGAEESHAAHYSRLARTVSRLPEPLDVLRHQGRLRRLPHVGPQLTWTLTELVDTGTCSKWTDWARRVPESVLELRDLPGLGPKRARLLYLEFGIDSIDRLRPALEAGWLTMIPGIGDKTVERLRRALEEDGRTGPAES